MRHGLAHPQTQRLLHQEAQEAARAEALQAQADKIRDALRRGAVALINLVHENRRAVKRSAFLATVMAAKQRQHNREVYWQLWRQSGRPLETVLGMDALPGNGIDRKAEEQLRKLELELEVEDILQASALPSSSSLIPPPLHPSTPPPLHPCTPPLSPFLALRQRLSPLRSFESSAVHASSSTRRLLLPIGRPPAARSDRIPPPTTAMRAEARAAARRRPSPPVRAPFRGHRLGGRAPFRA